MAALAQLGVEDDRSQDGRPSAEYLADASDRPANWGNMFAILLCDFMFSKACQLSAQAGSEVLSAMCEAFERACTGQLQEVERSSTVPPPRATMRWR